MGFLIPFPANDSRLLGELVPVGVYMHSVKVTLFLTFMHVIMPYYYNC